MAKVETYKGEINEYINWMNGLNELTERSISSNDPISGESIRNLITKHLKVPFVTYDDLDDNKIYFFSSNESKQLWLDHRYLDNNEKYLDLVLYSMTRPSDYKIELDSIFLENTQRYVSLGDENSDEVKMAYTWDIKLGDVSEVDNLFVSYEITTQTGKVKKVAENKNYSSRNDTTNALNLYLYLESGSNLIDILFSSPNTGAKKTLRINIVLVEFNLESSFLYYNKVESRNTFIVPIILNRNVTSLSANVYVNIDGNLASINGNNAGLPYTINPGVTGTVYLNINNSIDPETGLRPYRGSTSTLNIVHTMLIWAETSYNNVAFRSNLLYYTFEIKSDLVLANKFINVGLDLSASLISSYPIGNLTLFGTQYLPMTLPWGYYTDSLSYDTSVVIDWKLVQGENTYDLTNLKGEVGIKPSDLIFIPSINSLEEDVYLKAFHGEEELLSIPIVLYLSTGEVIAPSGMSMELSAYSKNNNTDNRNVWSTTGDEVNVILSSGITYDAASGWYNHSLRLSGITQYAYLDYNVFAEDSNMTIHDNGRTIEFEFESEKVNEESDIIMLIGTENKARIEVTPNSSTLYDNSNNMVIKTNFKSNERVKLAFILNPESITSDNNLVYIVTNGILERASTGGQSFVLSDGSIKIGGSNSGIKFYNMRVYNYAISYTTAYNNYVYDSDKKSLILANNNIMKNGIIDYESCCSKLDTILIEGNLDALLSGATDKDLSTTNATITRKCPYDSSKNFKVIDAQIRKHGQSTLSYPITSMKFWLNKKFQASNTNDIPRFTCEGLESLGLAKNRYKMKDSSIPANKFILLANYADSSGVHNGGLERLIHDTWYRTQVDGKYVLKTEPQLFTTLSSSLKSDYDIDHVWHDYVELNFPYEIRVAPDSFPCVVFYKNGEGEVTYLGQYVFMEDKKSDFCFGERSIYVADPQDPFCLKTVNKKADTDDVKVWDNSNVLRIEVLDINDIFTSYMNWTKDGLTFDADIPEEVTTITDPETGVTSTSVKERHYNWEDHFEMIYPDPDDLEGDPVNGTDKFGVNSKFRRKAQPFVDWVKWLTDTRNNYNVATDWWTAGKYSSAQLAFADTAEDHLDLYKMAAYYIFMLRFGLVDSGERNVQIKTYDGVHFHYEPWDMDIAMGNRNDGGIAFNPPVDRNTRLGEGFAISGKGRVVNGQPLTSNWLWDALEGWNEWSNVIVPKVAQGLFNAGLTYDNAAEMFDDNYANKWSEILYNESGYYKYILRGGGSQMYLNWLQGARMLHRHWWLSSSMNYYDARWSAGSFNDSRIDLFAGHTGVEGNEENIVIYPNASTYFKMEINANSLGTKSANRQTPASFNIGPRSFQSKNPTYIYGANFVERLDLTVIASALARISLGGSYDKILGASLKELDLGIAVTKVDDNTYTGIVNIADPGNIETTVGEGENKIYALTNLQTLNIRGQLGQGSETGNFYTTFSMLRDNVDDRGDLSNVKNLYAMGSGIANFYSSNQGNKFENLELPAEIYSINLNNTTWENISFWNSSLSGSNGTFTRYNIDNNYNYFVPISLTELVLNGTTGQTLNSKNFVMAWINGIIAELGANPTDEEINEALATKTLIMNDIKWSIDTCGIANLLTYDEISLLAKIGTKELKGYIMLADEGTSLTSEQLTQLTLWFGNDVFTYSSSGLIIDYNLNTTIISVSGDITIDTNNEVHLKEGHTAILNATQFHLNNQILNIVWTIRERIVDGNDLIIETISGDSVKSCYLDTSNPRQILLKAINSSNAAYDIFVHSSLGNSEIVVHIDPTDYPVLEIAATEGMARIRNEAYVIYAGNVNDNFTVNTVSTVPGAVDVQGVTWKIQLENGTIINAENTDPLNYTMVNNSDILKYRRGNSRMDIRLISDILSSDENIYTYYLIADVNLKGKIETLTKQIIVMYDMSAIVTADGSFLYNALNAHYNSLYGENTLYFYRSTLMDLTGTLSFLNYTNISRLVTSTNKSIFHYLINITGVDLSGCSAVTNTYTNGLTVIPQLDFSNIPGLQTLNLSGCTTLSGTIDLSNNSSIQSVNTEGTTLNIMLPQNSRILLIALGTPTEIEIDGATALSPTNVSVQHSANITELSLSNIKDSSNNNKTYNVFGKIMLNV